jgi:flagellar motor switch protein FliN/FliY
MGITQSDIDALLSTAGEPASNAEDQVAETAPPGPPASLAPASPGPQAPSAPRASDPPARRELDRILNLSLPLAVRLAQQQMPVERVLEINVGVIIEFDRSFEAELDLMIGDCRIGAGHAVKAGENFGLCIDRIGNLDEKIKALGGTESTP